MSAAMPLLVTPRMRLLRATKEHKGGAVITEPLFSPDQCAKIIREAEASDKVEPAKIGNSLGDISEYRRSWIHWLTDKEKWKWVYARVHTNINRINQMIWRFDLKQEEAIQFSRYDNNEKGHYDWHIDSRGISNLGLDRKLSFSVQLSDSRHYGGGALQLWPDFEMSRQQGACVIFPSYLLHRVEPVESGTRYSLVGWVLGPGFR